MKLSALTGAHEPGLVMNRTMDRRLGIIEAASMPEAYKFVVWIGGKSRADIEQEIAVRAAMLPAGARIEPLLVCWASEVAAL